MTERSFPVKDITVLKSYTIDDKQLQYTLFNHYFTEYFINNFQGYFTCTRVIIRLSQCQWSDPGECVWFNTLKPRQNCRHFTDDIFKCILLNENGWISLKISLKLVHKVRISNIQHLFRKWLGADQVTSHYLNQWWLAYWQSAKNLNMTQQNMTGENCRSMLMSWDISYKYFIFVIAHTKNKYPHVVHTDTISWWGTGDLLQLLIRALPSVAVILRPLQMVTTLQCFREWNCFFF